MPNPIRSLKAKGFEDRLIITNLGRQNPKETLLNYDPVDEDKNNLQNRKASAMRSHFVSLKKDLKKQNLPLPN